MASQKDKDYHKLRNPEKYPELNNGGDIHGQLTHLGAEAHERYKKLWSKFGFKSMVSDKRRRNTTRKSNQKNKQILHQMERAQNKVNFQAHLSDQDLPVITKVAHSSVMY